MYMYMCMYMYMYMYMYVYVYVYVVSTAHLWSASQQDMSQFLACSIVMGVDPCIIS